MSRLLRSRGLFARLALASLTTLAAVAPAFAAPVSDDNAGRWFDPYTDDSGVLEDAEPEAPRFTYDVVHDPQGRRVVLAQDAVAGAFTTSAIAPASFSAWGAIYLDYAAASDASVQVWAYDPAADLLYGASGATGSLEAPPAPLPLGASDDPAFGARASLAGVPASVGTLHLHVRLAGATLRPSVGALAATWTPRSVLGLALTAPASAQSADTISYRVQVAVSFVDATDLVVEAPLPSALANPRSQNQALTFVSATSGGQLVDDKVVWNLGHRGAGETFVLVYTVRTRMGLLDGTTYAATASATASNADARSAGPAQTVITSAPNLWTEKRLSGPGVFRIGDTLYALTESLVTVTVRAANHRVTPPRAGEVLFDPVIHDDVSELMAALGAGWVIDPHSVQNITAGGQFTASAVTLDNGVDVPPNSVYWRPADMPVGQTLTFSYQVRIAPAPPHDCDPSTGLCNGGQTFGGCATLRSTFAPQLADGPATSCADLVVGPPIAPGALFAKGERVRGYQQISSGQDLVNPTVVKVGYGEAVTYLLLTTNGGLSTLDDVVMLDKIPAELRFQDAYLPPETGGTVWYYVDPDGPAAPAAEPPSFNEDTGVLLDGWQDFLPADPDDVSWVAFRVPRLGSIHLSDHGLPTAALGEVTATVRPPDGPCPSTDVVAENRGLFRVYGYTPPNETAPRAQRIAHDEVEQTFIVPDLPNLAATSVTSTPATATAGQPLRYTVHIRNANPGNVNLPLDDALDMRLDLALPEVRANGVMTHLLLQSVNAAGGTVTYDLPSTVTIRWAAPLPPNGSRTVTVDLAVPPGVISGESFALNANLTAADDICGPVAVTRTRSTGFFGLPALQVAKSVDLAYGQPGTEITYRLDYVNSALTPSTGTWIVDRVPAGLALGRVQVPQPAGQVFFTQTPPGTGGVPAALSAADPFSQATLLAAFQPAIDDDGDGWVTSPFGAATTFVAFRVDDAGLTPPQLVTQQLRSVHIEATVTATQTGAVIANQGAVLANELLQAIGNKVNFTITGRPGLRIAKTCPAVMTSSADATYRVAYHNDSANHAASVDLTEHVPPGFTIVGATHAYNDVHLANNPSAAPATVTITGDEITVAAGPLAPLEGGELTVAIASDAGVASGTFISPETFGVAVADDGSTRSAYDACVVLIENPDLFVRKLVDNPAPRAGETFSYTLVLSNEGAHEATDVTLVDLLPAGVSYIPGSAVITPPPWSAASVEPAVVGQSLVWSAATDNALTWDTHEPGTFPGRSGSVSIILGARVDAGVVPGSDLENCVDADTALGEDDTFPNQACVTVTTPLPDPWVAVTGPDVRRQGERVTWTLTYGNHTNEVAGGVVVVHSLPDGPLPTADGAVDMSFFSAVAPHGEAVWYHTGTPGTAPAFDPDDPTAGGWTATPSADVAHVAFFAGDLDPYAAPRSVQVSALLASPTGTLTAPGSQLETCAAVAMTTPGFVDADPSNNHGCATVRVPGLDVALAPLCEPSGAFPGVTPGDLVAFTLTLTNSGTTLAHGVRLELALPAAVELVGDVGGGVLVTDGNDQPTELVDPSGQPIATPVSWTAVGDSVYLGDPAAEGATFYRDVGLRPGDRVALRLTTRVRDDVANGTLLVNQAIAHVDNAADGLPAEELTINNDARCNVTVYRADPFVLKSVANTTTQSSGLADAGDRLTYTLEYGNDGDFPAAAVVLEDAIPEGLAYVVGSLTNVDPDAADVTFSADGGLTWGYTPFGGAGNPDPAVTHIRVAWREDVPAPAGSVFVQATALDFQAGTHAGTRVDVELDGVVPVGGNRCDAVECPATQCDNGSWVPAGECCPQCRPAVPGCAEEHPVDLGCDMPIGRFERAGTWSGCYDIDDDNATCDGTCEGALDAYAIPAASCRSALKDAHGCLVGLEQLPQSCGPADATVWDACWTATCPDAPSWDCRAHDYAYHCAETYAYALERYADCLAADVDPSHCAMLAPTDDCTPCVVDACERVPDELKTAGSFGWWNVERVFQSLGSVAAVVIEKGLPLPLELVPARALDACEAPRSCRESRLIDSCAVPCGACQGEVCPECTLCPNGVACEVCLPTDGEGDLDGRLGGCETVAAALGGYYQQCVAAAADFPVAGAESLCEFVRPPDCGPPASCSEGTYTSPAFPADEEGRVIAWTRAVVEDVATDEDQSVVYTVVDPATGAAVPGFEAIASPETGAIDLSSIDPAEHPQLALRASLRGPAGTCLADAPLPELSRCEFGEERDEIFPYPTAMNANGTIAGYYQYYGQNAPGVCGWTTTGMVWIGDAAPHLVAPPTAAQSRVLAVNDDDVAVGVAYDDNSTFNPQRPFRWSQVEGAVILPMPEGSVHGAAHDINAHGTIVGVVSGQFTEFGPSEQRGVLWTVDGELVDLGPARPLDGRHGARLNDLGWALFRSAEDNGALVVDATGTRTEIPIANGDDGYLTIESRLNLDGGFAGFRYFSDTGAPFVWTPDAGLVYLPVPPASDFTLAFDRNDAGVVVGYSEYDDGVILPNRWGPDGELEVVPIPGWFLAGFFGINNAGQSNYIAVRFGPAGPEWGGGIHIPGYGLIDMNDQLPPGRIQLPEVISITAINDAGQVAVVSVTQQGGGGDGDGFADPVLHRYTPCDAPLALLGWRAIYRTDRNPSVGFSADVEPTCTSAIVNTADIATASPEITTENNTSSAGIAINRADLAVSIAVDKAVVGLSGDETLTWTVTWDNRGPGVARDVVIRADLPLATDDPGDRVVAQLDSLPPSSSGSTQISARVLSDEPDTTLTATASIASPTIDCAPSDDTSAVTTVIGSWPNVLVTLDGPPTASPGEPFTWVVSWGNNGNDVALGTELVVALPAGVELLAVDPDDNATAGVGTVTFDLGDLPAGATGSATLDVVIPDCADLGASLTGVATVVTESPEIDTSDNTDAAAVVALAPPGRLDLALVPSRATAEVGDPVTFSAYYRNDGTAVVAAAHLAVALPAGLEPLADGASPGASAADGALHWSVGDLAPGAGGAVHVTARVTAALASELTATAALGGAGACGVDVAAPAVLVTAPGVHLVKSASHDVVCDQREGPVTFSVTVTNTGATAAGGLTVVDAVPAGFAYVPGSVAGPGADATEAPTLRWQLGSLPPGAGLTLSYRAQPLAGVGVEGAAILSAAVANGDHGTRRSGAAAVRKDCAPALRATKAWTAACSLAGATHAMTLTVRNLGSDRLMGVTLRDVLPEALTFVAAADGSYAPASRLYAATFDLEPGETRALTVEVAVADAVAAGTLFTNEASVTGGATGGGVFAVTNRVAAVALTCDDGNACTANTCAPALGCLFPPVDDGLTCDDGDACTQVDACVAGACVGDEPVTCEATSQCHVPGVCDPATGACSEPTQPDGWPCDDGDACTVEDACQQGVCTPAGPLACADGDDCTADLCDSELGCVFPDAADGTACDDGDLCSSASACQAGTCVGTLYPSCDDGDACTINSCVPDVGCVAEPAPDFTPCDDGDLCTLEDFCTEGLCGGTPLTCDAPGECELAGTCNPATGVCDYPAADGDSPLPIVARDLGTLGGAESGATAASDGGWVAGFAETASGARHAFRWHAELTAGLEDLTPDSAGPASAIGVNDDGDVAGVLPDGVVFFHDGQLHALWTRADVDGAASPVFGPTADGLVAGTAATDGGLTATVAAAGVVSAIPSPVAGADTIAHALSESGYVVGEVRDDDGPVVAFVWDGAAATTLAAPGAVDTVAEVVSDAGHAAGFMRDAAGAERAVVWLPDGTPEIVDPDCDLAPAAPGPCLEGGRIVAVAASGAYVGHGEWPGLGLRPFVGVAGGDATILDVAGALRVAPVAMNAHGDVAGTWTTTAGAERAFVWTASAGLLDLPSPGDRVELLRFTDSGFVVGTFRTLGGVEQAFLWAADRGFQPVGGLGGGASRAAAADELGHVAGTAQTATGVARAFVTRTPAFGCFVCDEDVTPPVIVCPLASEAVECAPDGAVVALGAPSARDECSFPVTVASDAPDRFPHGTTEVTWTATDAAGNEASCRTVVTVADTTPPTISCPERVDAISTEDICGAVVDLQIAAEDACSGDEVLLIDTAPEVYPIGETVVTTTAIDASGNAATCETVVVVTNDTPLTIACDPSLTVDAPADFCGWPDALSAEVVDTCDVSVTVQSAADSFPIGVSTVSFSANNPAGEEVACETRLTVRDVTPPQVACGAPAAVIESALPGVFVPSASDACGAELTVSALTCTTAAGEAFAEGCDATTEVTAVVFDGLSVEVEGDVTLSWTVAAVDPSGNRAEVDCATTLRRDRDADGVPDDEDNCPDDFNPDQADLSGSGVGDVCDFDGIEATGGGGCAGGGTPGAPLALVLLLGLLLLVRARRRRAAPGRSAA